MSRMRACRAPVGNLLDLRAKSFAHKLPGILGRTIILGRREYELASLVSFFVAARVRPEVQGSVSLRNVRPAYDIQTQQNNATIFVSLLLVATIKLPRTFIAYFLTV